MMKRIFWKFLVLVVVVLLGGGICYAQDPLKKPQKRTEQSGSKPAKKTTKKGSSQSGKQVNQSGKKTTGTINGHEWVDLGLPSGLKWATCNVGASTPEGPGDYFAWGETTIKNSYSESNNATFDKEFSWLRSNGYIDSYGNLTMAHDAARQNWGGTWRMPTLAEIKELKEYTTTEWTTRNGMNGRLVKSKRNGATIFLPASGWYNDGYNNGERFGFGSYPRYWSSTANSGRNDCAFYLFFDSGCFDWGSYNNRCSGLTVRPVTK